jgi:hypothetical protein
MVARAAHGIGYGAVSRRLSRLCYGVDRRPRELSM